MEVVNPHSLLRAKTIHRRYSDFHHLRAELIRENPELVSSLPFPSKRFFGSNLDQAFLDRRLEGLQVFLGTVIEMKDLKQSKALQSFLRLSSNENPEDATKLVKVLLSIYTSPISIIHLGTGRNSRCAEGQSEG